MNNINSTVRGVISRNEKKKPILKGGGKFEFFYWKFFKVLAVLTINLILSEILDL